MQLGWVLLAFRGQQDKRYDPGTLYDATAAKYAYQVPGMIFIYVNKYLIVTFGRCVTIMVAPGITSCL